MKSEKGIYIRLIKGFKFPEPVFHPKKLKNDFRFLANSSNIKKRIDLMKGSKYEKIEPYGYLKPIRNP
ncbi:MAG: hypothetical protein HF967_03230 [Methanosarcinales archaeon]|nr:hypothetical protein [Methanosarcinales archaeon]